MNILLAIADSDRDYLKKISEELQGYQDLTIHVYTSADKLETAMESETFDVLMFDPDLSDARINFSKVKMPICLYSEEAEKTSLYKECARISKYQRISRIYKEMIQAYAEKAGYSYETDHSGHMKVVAVYSPIGGSGKTTAALSIAGQAAKKGKQVLFLSLEALGSSAILNTYQEPGIVALTEAASDKNVNFELKIKGLVKQGTNQMYYVEGFERLADYHAVSGEEIENVIKQIQKSGVCDYLIVDLDSNSGAIEMAVMKLADKIVITEKPGELCSMKMQLFLQQGIVNEHKKKMLLIRNFAENNISYCSQNELEEAGLIHNYGNLQLKNTLHAIEKNGEIDIKKILEL